MSPGQSGQAFSRLGPHFLELGDERLDYIDASLLELAREHLALGVRYADALQLLVVLQEEAQVLERDVDLGVATQLAVLLDGVLPSREGVFVDLSQRAPNDSAGGSVSARRSSPLTARRSLLAPCS